MSQYRYVELGNTFGPNVVNGINSALKSAGLLVGGDLFINSNSEIGINPLKAIFESGIVLVEDQIKTLTVTLSSLSASYTIVYTHSTSENLLSGTEATLELLNGLLNQDDLPKNESTGLADSVVLGWVNYPGNSVPLDVTMLCSPHRLSARPNFKNDVVSQAVIGNDFLTKCYLVNGANTVDDDIEKEIVFDETQGTLDFVLINNKTNTKRLDIFVPFINGVDVVRKIIILANLSTGSKINVTIRTNGKVILPSNGNLVVNNTYAVNEIKIPFSGLSDMRAMNQFLAKLSVIMDANSTIKLRYCSASIDDLQ